MVQEPHMHVVTRMLTTITHQSCLRFVILLTNHHPRLSCRQCCVQNLFARYNMSCKAAKVLHKLIVCMQAAGPTKEESSMGEGKASFGRAGGVCQDRVAKQVGHGCG